MLQHSTVHRCSLFAKPFALAVSNETPLHMPVLYKLIPKDASQPQFKILQMSIENFSIIKCSNTRPLSENAPPGTPVSKYKSPPDAFLPTLDDCLPGTSICSLVTLAGT